MESIDKLSFAGEDIENDSGRVSSDVLVLSSLC
jgi:hypothetical protein